MKMDFKLSFSAAVECFGFVVGSHRLRADGTQAHLSAQFSIRAVDLASLIYSGPKQNQGGHPQLLPEIHPGGARPLLPGPASRLLPV